MWKTPLRSRGRNGIWVERRMNLLNQWATGEPVAFWYSTYECPGRKLAIRRCYTSTQGGTPMKKQTDTFEICLCHSCASVFYNSPSHRISRVDPLQVIKDTCDCCRSNRGYDFRLSANASNSHSRMGQACYAEYSRPTM